MFHRDKHGAWWLSRRARLVLWLAVAVLCIGGGGLRLYLTAQHRAAMTAWTADAQRREKLHLQLVERVQQLLETHPGDAALTKEQVEAEFNGGRPLRPTAKPGTYLCDDTESDTRLELWFTGGKWNGVSVHSLRIVRMPTQSWLDIMSESIRKGIAGTPTGAAPIGWAASFLASLLVLRYRHVLAELSLVCAVATTVGTLVHPVYNLTWRGITSNDNMALAPILIGLSLAAMLIPSARHDGEGPPQCRQCGYNLTGNVSGVCPECGTPITQPADNA